MVDIVFIVFTISIIVAVLVLITLYFLAFRKFFSFMKEERMKFYKEMDCNVNEIKEEFDKNSILLNRNEGELIEKDE